MRVGLDTSPYDIPAGAVIGTIALDDAPGTRLRLMAQARERLEKARAEQKEWSRRFDRLYEEARGSNWNAPVLTEWTAALLEKQRAAWELFHPVIEELERKAAVANARPDPELLELVLATISLVLGWISPYQALTGQLLELVAERRAGSDVIMRARPVAGEIDHGAITREIISRYPKILEALAK